MTRNLVIITVELGEPEREGANGNPALGCGQQTTQNLANRKVQSHICGSRASEQPPSFLALGWSGIHQKKKSKNSNRTVVQRYQYASQGILCSWDLIQR